jgi:hypothetical protein
LVETVNNFASNHIDFIKDWFKAKDFMSKLFGAKWLVLNDSSRYFVVA